MPTKADQVVLQALQRFGAAVAAKFKGLAAGEPEDQLRAPLENFLTEFGKATGRSIVAKGESLLEGRIGRPDYAVLVEKLLAGYVELKAPGKGANPDHYKGSDRAQWKRFQCLPNLLYADGNELALYRNGERVGELARLFGDVTKSGAAAVKPADVPRLTQLLTDFLSWDPIIPQQAAALAELLAPLCRMLREEVRDALKSPTSPLVQLAKDWRQLLFPDADDDRFADAYAQTVTFALLLARSEGARTLDEDLHRAVEKLAADHALLSRALQVLTDPAVRVEIAPPLRLLQRVTDRVPIDAFRGHGRGGADPWLYFYEDFLAAYDPDLRKDAGAYYTPTEIVRAQVRLIDRLLVDKLQRRMGFAEPSVITLDPAVGTGTYLLGVIDHAMRRVELALGRGAVPGYATDLGRHIYGFEIMVGPYAVAQLRVTRSLVDHGATLPKDGPGVYLTDTLESPHAQAPQTGLFYQPLADQHQRALRVKDQEPVIVCLGNPPYDRHPAAESDSAEGRARSGGWVRWGDPGGGNAILRDFLQPALDAGHGGDVKNAYNLYVYFWRWALWKTFEHTSAPGSGVVSYISAASYLDGDAFVGMRERLRRLCDEVWIIDLGGSGRGTRKDENVFAIQTQVAIAVAVRYGKPNPETPAVIHYTQIEGTHTEKLARLESINDFADLQWERCPNDWQAPFRLAGVGRYFVWPQLIDLMPWQHSGVQLKRTWPIGPDEDTLKRRWRALLTARDRAAAFRESGDRVVAKSYRAILPTQERQKAITLLPSSTPAPDMTRYAFRSFDRQWIIADGRLISRPRPELWGTHGERQLYVTTLLNHPLGEGPALTAASEIPDLHHFRGSFGARETIPLYRDSAAREPNVVPGLLDLLSRTYRQKVGPEDFLAYAYGVLAQPSFTRRFRKELQTRELRLPLTKDAKLFAEVNAIGQRLLWLHTYAQRLSGPGRPKGKVPVGRAKCTRAVSDKPDAYPDEYHYDPATRRLTVGSGIFEPVEPAVVEFDVSGMKVVDWWLGYRMRSGRGKRSSPLDGIRPLRWTAQFTTELLELLWMLDATVATYSEQERILDLLLRGPLFRTDELPAVPPELRSAPAAQPGLFPQEDQADDE